LESIVVLHFHAENLNLLERPVLRVCLEGDHHQRHHPEPVEKEEQCEADSEAHDAAGGCLEDDYPAHSFEMQSELFEEY
jgi:hypothetical protein